MKRLLLILFLFPFVSLCQDKPIDGFMGLKFGALRPSVEAFIKSKGGVLSKDIALAPNAPTYTGLTFGGRRPSSITFYFTENKLYMGIILFSAEKEPQTFDLYLDIVKDLKEVYGSSVSKRDFKTPFELGDGYEVTAIEGGYATISDGWVSNGNGIQIKIAESLVIGLIYQDTKLFEESKKGRNPLRDY